MTDALVAAIENDPYDVENYRVYGDWLEEQGDPRGQLIAMYILKDRLTDRAKLDHLGRRLAEYRHRNRDALMGVCPSWMDPELYPGYVRWRFGFIHSLDLSPGVFSDETTTLEMMMREPSLRFLTELRISASRDEPRLVYSQVPASLRKLHLYFYDRTDVRWSFDGCSRLSDLSIHDNGNAIDVFMTASWPALASLAIGDVRRLTALRNVLCRTDLPCLTKLSLWGLGGADEIAADLVSTPVGMRLRELDLSRSGLTDAGVQLLLENPPKQHFAVVDVRDTPTTEPARKLLQSIADRVFA